MRHFLLFLISCIVLKATAQNAPPIINTVSVQPNGNIRITWDPPTPSAGLFNYAIYRSSNGGISYTSLGTTTSTSYTEATGTGNIIQNYYYIDAQYSSGTPAIVHSDTLKSIFLIVPTPVSGALSIAKLSWNPLHLPALPRHANGKYYIYKQYSNKYLFVDSTIQTTYTDTNRALCTKPTATVTYHVLFVLNKGTGKDTSSSTYTQKAFHDDIPPKKPNIIGVTVDTITQKTIICWHAVHDMDLKGYAIIKDPATLQTSTGDSIAKPDTCLLIQHSNPNGSAESFSVFAYDSCGNAGLYSTLGHAPIFLQSRLDFCAGKIFLNWTTYKGWPMGVTGYAVYVSENGKPYQLLTPLGPNDTSYVHASLTPFSQYRYYIKTQQAGSILISISNSPPARIFTAAHAPAYINVSSLNSMGQTDSVVLAFETDPQGQPKEFKVFRADSSKKFNEISTIPAVNNQTTYSLNDNKVFPSLYNYYYRVIATDSCGQTLQLSDTVGTMLLKVTHNDSLVNTLRWTPYKGWHGNLANYNVYESINNKTGAQYITGIARSQTGYKREISNHIDANGRFCYYIEAAENGGNGNKSYSNEVCDVQTPRIFVPNAIIPESAIAANQVFKPVSDFVDINQYKMIIYNRWAEKIFESTAPNTGWDGTFHGSICVPGIYIYHITFTGTNGFSFEKKGTIALIR